MNLGLLLGFFGVAIFSVTLPVTKLALAGGMQAPFVSFGRAVLAGAVAIVVLWVARAPWPRASLRKDIALASLGIVIGWPAMSTLALLYIPPSHAAVVSGLLPFSTALIGATITHTWPKRGFWVCAIVGACVVTSYAAYRGGGGWQLADGLLLMSVFLGGLGYAYGARASQHLPGWQVISWALVFALPLTIPVSGWFAPVLSAVTPKAWAAFTYLALMSQYIGFFFWYRGLALGGIAKVSQVQLLQIFMTFAVSAALVGESIDVVTWSVAVLIVFIIALSKRL
jgi:drug/metabolite transporter (DMT)-like permease